MIKDSFVKMEKEKVIKLCENIITEINKVRYIEEEKFLQEQVDKINRSLIRRLFRRPKITIENIRTQYKHYEDWPFYPSQYAWGTLENARRILRAAYASDGDVYLSSSDLYSIS